MYYLRHACCVYKFVCGIPLFAVWYVCMYVNICVLVISVWDVVCSVYCMHSCIYMVCM